MGHRGGSRRAASCAITAGVALTVAVASSAVAAPTCRPAAGATSCTVTVGPVSLGGPGTNAKLPVTVPRGVNRIDAAFQPGETRKIGLGLFDQRGSGFQSPGFRGIAGEERKAVFVATDTATPGFIPGRVRPGTWTVIVPNFLALGSISVRVTMTFGPNRPTPSRQAVPELVKAQPGWYKGDLHVHTVFSSDAASSGKALSPAAMAQRAKAQGLDFLNLSDHNVTAQNNRLRDDAPADLLLLGGEEVTSWQGGPGHLTAAGLQSGDWLDWRFKPRNGRYANWAAWTADDRPIQDLLAVARGLGVYTSANHPFVAPGFGSDWGFFEDSDVDINALPDGMEVWNDDFWLTFSFAALQRWDQEIARGRHVCGNGGSDVHGVGGKTEVGRPTTVVYAPELSRAAIVDGMKRCRMYLSDRPSGPAVTLTAATPQGEAMMGSTVSGPATTVVPVSAHIVGGNNKWVEFLRNGEPVWWELVQGNDATITRPIGIGQGGGVRVQLHDFPLNARPRALTNPIFLREGPAGLTW